MGDALELRVHVYEAKGLIDRGGLFVKQSPYCTIKIAGQKLKTNVHMDGGCNPVFNQELCIRNVTPKDDFQIEVKGYHTSIPKTHLGVFGISLGQAMHDGRTGRKLWCPLTNVKKPDKDAGQLCLRFDIRKAPPPYVDNAGSGDVPSLSDSTRPTEDSTTDHAPPRRNTYSHTQHPPSPPRPLKNAFSEGEHDTNSSTLRETPAAAPYDAGARSRPPSGLGSTNDISKLRRTLSQDEVDWTDYEELRPYARFYVYPSQVSIIRQVHTDYIQTDYMRTQLGHFGGNKVMITSAKVPTERPALIKEVIALSKVDCPLILAFVGFYIDRDKGGLHCITNHSLANPPTLHKYLQRMGSRLTLHEKLTFAIDVAGALVYMHQLGMMHRGIKAENVMLTTDKKAVLSGFGTCRDRSYDQTLTVGVGDIQWSAPEMLIDGDYIEKVDVYSFGVLLVEIETNQTPFEDERKVMSRIDLTNAILMGRLRPTPTPACPPVLKALIHMCLQVDPNRRPTMVDILSSLQDIQNRLYR